MTITIERLSELYQQGYYSELDFYLGLIELIVESNDLDRVLEKVPQRLFGFVAEQARDHDLSAAAAGRPEEQGIPQAILRWLRKHPAETDGGNGSACTDEPSFRTA